MAECRPEQVTVAGGHHKLTTQFDNWFRSDFTYSVRPEANNHPTAHCRYKGVNKTL